MQILNSNVYDIDTVKMNCKTYMYIWGVCVCMHPYVLSVLPKFQPNSMLYC